MDMLTHAQIWAAIDALASKQKMSASGLARNSGLDPTTFNPSKRFTAAGRERWPSTESIAKILRCTNTSVDDFMSLLAEFSSHENAPAHQPYKNINYRETLLPKGIPLIGSAQAGTGGFFDDSGFPVGHGWETIELPLQGQETSYALKVSGDSMLPLYREGDVLIVDPAAAVRKGDRVVAKTRNGEVFAKILGRRTNTVIEFRSANPDHADLSFTPDDLDWIARIIWASQ